VDVRIFERTWLFSRSILVDEKKEGGKNRAENVEENFGKYFGTLVRWEG